MIDLFSHKVDKSDQADHEATDLNCGTRSTILQMYIVLTLQPIMAMRHLFHVMVIFFS